MTNVHREFASFYIANFYKTSELSVLIVFFIPFINEK